jgi:hypothetical protein
MLAMQEDFVASAVAESSAAFVTGRGGAPMVASPMEAPPAAGPIADEKVSFEPVPVFVGPKPGWTGPVMAARDDAGDDPAPARLSAYSAQKDAKAPEAGGAKAVLKTLVKPPRLKTTAKLKPTHFTPEARARKAAAVQRVEAKKTKQR